MRNYFGKREENVRTFCEVRFGPHSPSDNRDRISLQGLDPCCVRASYSYASTYLALYMCVFLLTGLGSQVLGNFFNGIGRTKETLKMGIVQLAIFLLAAPVMA